MPDKDDWTIGRLLTWTTEFLGDRGIETPRLDAELLLAKARDCQRIELYTTFNDHPDDTQRTAFRQLVRQRAAGTPVAYLLGEREFYSLPFHVTPDVLIPRPETEFVIVSLLDLAKENPNTLPDEPKADEQERDGQNAEGQGSSQPLAIADVGTGSGILAVCAARYLPQSQVTAIDISRAALAVAHQNIQRHEVTSQVTLIESDLFAAVPAEIIARLIEQAADRLHAGGWLIFEMSPMIESKVRQLILNNGHFDPPTITKDLAKLPRVVATRRQ